MKFLVDAQLPRRLAGWLTSQGLDAKHTLDLPKANASSDEEVMDVADLEDRVIVTKDADFVQSHILLSRPRRLWLTARATSATQAWKQWSSETGLPSGKP